MINFPIVDKSGVTPSDRPTVPKAETTSKRSLSMGATSVRKRQKEKPKIKKIAINKVAKAIKTLCESMVFFKKSNRNDDLIIFQKEIKIRANVVVLIPPPVDTGDAPIIIKIRQIIIVLGWNIVISVVIKPAVRVVTDWK